MSLKRYGFFGTLHLIVSKMYTMIKFPGAKIVRLPIDIRNAKSISIGKNFVTGKYCRFEVEVVEIGNKKQSGKIEIGENVQVNDLVHITSGEHVTIGNDTLIASKVLITDLDHGNYSSNINLADSPAIAPALRRNCTSPVSIGKKVWIGEGVSILKGSQIGDGTIVAAHSLVNGVFPDSVIIAGIPARIIKKWDVHSKSWKSTKDSFLIN